MSEKLLRRFQNQVDGLQSHLDKFAEDFARDPAYALSWSNDTFAAAAKLRILRQIITAIQQDTSVDADSIRATMMDRVLHKSRYPAQSTSPTSNLIEQYELAACAYVLSNLQYVTE